jgi:fructokinase
MQNMNTNPKVVCFGELLIDMISTTTGDLIQSKGFLKKFGGAPANTAMGLAKQNVPVSFMGKVGADPFGNFLKNTLDNNNVDTSHLLLDKHHLTTLAYVSLDKEGNRDFFFFRGAHEYITSTEVDLPFNTRIFHFGSLTQIHEVVKKTTEELIDKAAKSGTIISYDPNIRESLWGDLNKAKTIIMETKKKVNIFKVNFEEALLLSGEQTISAAAKRLFSDNLDAVFITNGSKGCYYKTANGEGNIPTIHVSVVDTTGAGDAFNAGLLAAIYKQQKPVKDMTKTELELACARANVIASLTTTKKGAVTAFPKKAEIDKALKDLGVL